MADIFRRVDIAQREDRALRQVRYVASQAPEGAPSGATATWGNITGTLSNQTDLNQQLKDSELMHHWMDD